MNQDTSSENETNPDSEGSTKDNKFGLKLKKQREVLNMTQADAASKLKLDVSYIDAMETEDFSNMSSSSYVYGYIRGYAKLLKLPEEEILDMYKQGINEEHQLLPDYMGNKATYYSSSPTLNKTWSVWFIIGVGVLVTIWWYVNKQ